MCAIHDKSVYRLNSSLSLSAARTYTHMYTNKQSVRELQTIKKRGREGGVVGEQKIRREKKTIFLFVWDRLSID